MNEDMDLEYLFDLDEKSVVEDNILYEFERRNKKSNANIYLVESQDGRRIIELVE